MITTAAIVRMFPPTCAQCETRITGAWEPMLVLSADSSEEVSETTHGAICGACIGAMYSPEGQARYLSARIVRSITARPVVTITEEEELTAAATV